MLDTLFIRRFASFLVATISIGLFVADAAAQVSPVQRRDFNELRTTVKKAERLFEAKNLAEASQEVQKAIPIAKRLVGDGGNATLNKILTPTMTDLARVYGFLELHGAKLAPLPRFALPGSRPATRPQSNTPATPNPATPSPTPTPTPGTPAPMVDPLPATGPVSFAKHVAPLLVRRCGGCHVNRASGDFSMANYSAMMKGTELGGGFILKGDGKGSLFIEVLESGDMPRNGGKLPAAEISLLTRWIDQGAKNDAPNFNAPLRQLARAAEPRAQRLEVTQATGNETVSFKKDLAPVLLSKCAGCHGRQQPSGGLRVTNFQQVLRGGDTGLAVQPGQGATSLLIRKLKGTAGRRMPARGGALSLDVITKFETWINEGARYDGEDPRMDLTRLVELARAEESTPEDLSIWREELTKKNWQLAVPDVKSKQVQSKNFYVVGSGTERALQAIANSAEAKLSFVKSALRVTDADAIIKGRLTLYVFTNRFDYAEFGKMVERRDLPRTWRGHWRYDTIDPYVLVVPPTEDEYSLDTLLTQQLAAFATAARTAGNAPRWLSEGTGRAVAAQADSGDARIKEWDSKLIETINSQDNPADFLNGRLPPSQADIISYAFVKQMLTSKPRFNRLLVTLSEGKDINESMKRAYEKTATELAPGWVQYVTAGGKPKAEPTSGRRNRR